MPCAARRLVELDHAEHVAEIGERQRGHAVGGRRCDRVVDAHHAVDDRVLAVQAQMDEAGRPTDSWTRGQAVMMYNFTRFDFTLWTALPKITSSLAEPPACAGRAHRRRLRDRAACACRCSAGSSPRRRAGAAARPQAPPTTSANPPAKSICRVSLCPTGRVTPTAAPAPAPGTERCGTVQERRPISHRLVRRKRVVQQEALMADAPDSLVPAKAVTRG